MVGLFHDGRKYFPTSEGNVELDAGSVHGGFVFQQRGPAVMAGGPRGQGGPLQRPPRRDA